MDREEGGTRRRAGAPKHSVQEVYRIPKKSQVEKETTAERGREATGRDPAATPEKPEQGARPRTTKPKQRKEKAERLPVPPFGVRAGHEAAR
ncbi:UNVERIFIED_CONTAM: hypothetical protein K2H54_000965 [Gekko kuhli]